MVADTRRDRLLVPLAQEDSADRQPAPVVSGVVEALGEASAAGAVDSAATAEEEEAEVSAVALAVLEVAEALEAVGVVSDISQTASLQTVLLQAREGEGAADSVVVEAAAMEKTDHLVGMETGTKVPVVPITNRSAAETVTAMVIATKGTVAVETTVTHESVDMKATAMTIRDNDGGTEPYSWLRILAHGFVKGYLPFLRLVRLLPFITKGKSLINSRMRNYSNGVVIGWSSFLAIRSWRVGKHGPYALPSAFRCIFFSGLRPDLNFLYPTFTP